MCGFFVNVCEEAYGYVKRNFYHVRRNSDTLSVISVSKSDKSFPILTLSKIFVTYLLLITYIEFQFALNYYLLFNLTVNLSFSYIYYYLFFWFYEPIIYINSHFFFPAGLPFKIMPLHKLI